MSQKRIMDCFVGEDEWFSFALKRQAGFGKEGREKLRRDHHGPPDERLSADPGLPAADQQEGAPLRLAHLCLHHAGGPVGYDHIASAYSVEPEESKALIYEQTQKNFPDASQEELDAVLGWPR